MDANLICVGLEHDLRHQCHLTMYLRIIILLVLLLPQEHRLYFTNQEMFHGSLVFAEFIRLLKDKLFYMKHNELKIQANNDSFNHLLKVH